MTALTLWALSWASLAGVLAITTHMEEAPDFVRSFKVGGLRFLRIGRFQASFCVVKKVKRGGKS